MFENLNEMRSANKKTSTRKKAVFQMKVNADKSIILFSEEQFTAMNIADNSLSQFNDDKKGIVFIAVMPGNSGTFAKTNARGTKGKRFKNIKLVQSLIDNNYDMAEIGLHEVGTEEGKTLYQVTGNGVDELPVEGNASEKTPDSNHMSEAEVSFEARAGEPIAEPETTVEEGTDVAQDEAIEDALTTEKASGELEF